MTDLTSSSADQRPLDEFFATLTHARFALLFLDYDGTLAPFHRERNEAVPYPGVRELLRQIRMLEGDRLVIVSGRAVDDLIPLLGLDPAPEIWGSHGWERQTASGARTVFEMAPAHREGLERARASSLHLGEALEVKPASVALHWRGRSAAEIGQLQTSIGAAWQRLADELAMELKPFDGGIELRVPGRDKGRAVEAVLTEMDAENTAAAYLGDDLTDEDAFDALAGRGLRVLVRREPRETLADCRLEPPGELMAFLERWLTARRAHRSHSKSGDGSGSP